MPQPLHVILQPRPADAEPGPSATLDGCRVATLKATALGDAPGWSLTFEQAVAGMERLPALFVEPDGSFTWGNPPGQPIWRIDGNLYDYDDRLRHIDLKLACPGARLLELTEALGLDSAKSIAQFVPQGRFFEIPELGRWLDARCA